MVHLHGSVRHFRSSYRTALIVRSACMWPIQCSLLCQRFPRFAVVSAPAFLAARLKCHGRHALIAVESLSSPSGMITGPTCTMAPLMFPHQFVVDTPNLANVDEAKWRGRRDRDPLILYRVTQLSNVLHHARLRAAAIVFARPQSDVTQRTAHLLNLLAAQHVLDHRYRRYHVILRRRLQRHYGCCHVSPSPNTSLPSTPW